MLKLVHTGLLVLRVRECVEMCGDVSRWWRCMDMCGGGVGMCGDSGDAWICVEVVWGCA